MKISSLEQAEIKAVVEAGRKFGYGNMISHLKSAWAETLMKDYGFTEEAAQHASGNGYPVTMHRDLVDNGEWDETGYRYLQ